MTKRTHHLPSSASSPSGFPAFRLRLLTSVLCLLTSALLLPDLATTTAEAAQNANRRVNNALSRAGKAGNKTRQANKKNARPDGTEGPLANIDENWFLEVTPSYLSTTHLIGKFYGACLALGYRVTQEDTVKFEIGLYNSANYSSPFAYTRTGLTYDGTVTPVSGAPAFSYSGAYNMDYTGTRAAKAKMLPLLVSYSYNMRLDSRERWEFRLTPVIGFLNIYGKYTVNATGKQTIYHLDGPIRLDAIQQPAPGSTFTSTPTTQGAQGEIITGTDNYSASDSNYWAFTMGGGFSFAYHFADHWYAEAGYRFLWTGKVADRTGNLYPGSTQPWNGATPWNTLKAWNGMDLHCYSVSLVWKF